MGRQLLCWQARDKDARTDPEDATFTKLVSPSTLNPEPCTLNPKLYTLNPIPLTLHPTP